MYMMPLIGVNIYDYISTIEPVFSSPNSIVVVIIERINRKVRFMEYLYFVNMIKVIQFMNKNE